MSQFNTDGERPSESNQNQLYNARPLKVSTFFTPLEGQRGGLEVQQANFTVKRPLMRDSREGLRSTSLTDICPFTFSLYFCRSFPSQRPIGQFLFPFVIYRTSKPPGFRFPLHFLFTYHLCTIFPSPSSIPSPTLDSAHVLIYSSKI